MIKQANSITKPREPYSVNKEENILNLEELIQVGKLLENDKNHTLIQKNPELIPAHNLSAMHLKICVNKNIYIYIFELM